MRMKNILFMLRTKLNTTSKLVFVSFPVNKRLRKANNEDHCLVHHVRFGMRNRRKKRIPNRKPRNKLLNSFLVDSRVSNPQTKGISIFGNQQQGIRSMKF